MPEFEPEEDSRRSSSRDSNSTCSFRSSRSFVAESLGRALNQTFNSHGINGIVGVSSSSLMTDPQTEVENLRERIQNSDEISEKDALLLIEFIERIELLPTVYGDYRRRDLLAHTTRMAEEIGGLAETLEDREAAEEIVRWIHREYENEWTNAGYRDSIRVFSGVMTEGDADEKPPSTGWIPSGTSKDHDPRPNPGDMLEWDKDVKPMIDNTQNSRDKALIAVAFDAGSRSGELQDPEKGDVSDHEYGLQIQFDGRMGQRSVTLIPSVPYLNRWLSDHPASDDPQLHYGQN